MAGEQGVPWAEAFECFYAGEGGEVVVGERKEEPFTQSCAASSLSPGVAHLDDQKYYRHPCAAYRGGGGGKGTCYSAPGAAALYKSPPDAVTKLAYHGLPTITTRLLPVCYPLTILSIAPSRLHSNQPHGSSSEFLLVVVGNRR